MAYKIFRLAKTSIGRQEITFLEDIGDSIQWRTKDWHKDGEVYNSFPSVEAAFEKLTELFEKERNEQWEELSVNRHEEYTVLPVK